MNKYCIVMSVEDNDDRAVSGPFTQQQAIDILEGFRDSSLEHDEESLLDDLLDDAMPKLVVFNQSGVPITFEVIALYDDFVEMYKEYMP